MLCGHMVVLINLVLQHITLKNVFFSLPCAHFFDEYQQNDRTSPNKSIRQSYEPKEEHLLKFIVFEMLTFTHSLHLLHYGLYLVDYIDYLGHSVPFASRGQHTLCVDYSKPGVA